MDFTYSMHVCCGTYNLSFLVKNNKYLKPVKRLLPFASDYGSDLETDTGVGGGGLH